ncbi:aminotransferase class I/II-fold pyridoxal phosphate-dependent enzyme [Erythrobacter sp. Alg231-14]|uniref:aminotransferase class I/II-fold pyridoxal phosphate-dependent enzyme n=1 Tax=Erythrobacter sp. Alg231-14 TaxID=1922225 RepID=UPI000D54F87C
MRHFDCEKPGSIGATIAAYIAHADTTLHDALQRLDQTGGGPLMVVDDTGRLVRMVTDGDIRRLLLDGRDQSAILDALPPIAPVTARMTTTLAELSAMFETAQVTAIPRLDDAGVPRLLERRDNAGAVLLSTPHLGGLERDFVQQAFDTNWIAPLGPQVEGFETELAQYSENGHVAALSSGTAALHLGLILLGVKDGDRVYCPSFTFAASANPIRYERAIPVFIDSEPQTWNMSPKALERALARDKACGALPAAIIIANLYGQSADMDALMALADAYGVPVLEDAAESLGATFKGRKSGSFGTLAAYSFNGNKIITTSGGGALCGDDGDMIERARFLATQAREAAAHYEHQTIGFNYRMSNVLAGIGRGQLKVLDDRVRRRRAIFEIYCEALNDIEGIDWMPEPNGYFSTRWLTAAVFNDACGLDRTRILNGLQSVGVEARPVWKPMHRQPVFEAYEFEPHDDGRIADQSVSDNLFNGGLCLPSGSNMDDATVYKVCEQIRYWAKG